MKTWRFGDDMSPSSEENININIQYTEKEGVE